MKITKLIQINKPSSSIPSCYSESIVDYIEDSCFECDDDEFDSHGIACELLKDEDGFSYVKGEVEDSDDELTYITSFYLTIGKLDKIAKVEWL